MFEGRYAIHALLGSGAFGAVYRATQLTMQREVALKVLKADLIREPSLTARFRQEARTLAGLKHPGIIELIDFGESADGRLFLVTELLTGETLADLLAREAPLPQARVVSLAIEALDALADAHHAGIIHRDLKPENLFIARQGRRGEVLKILDFGIAKLADDDPARLAVTADGMTLGSPRFMSPEQCMASPVSAQSDLYSLGLVLYEAICGRPAFDKQTMMEYMMAHVREQPSPPSVDGVVLRGPHIDFIMQCLQKDPARRPASATEAVAALEAVHSRLPTVMAAEAVVVDGGGALEAAATVAMPVNEAVARAFRANAADVAPAESPSDEWTVVAPSPLHAKSEATRGAAHGYDGASTANTAALSSRPALWVGAVAAAALVVVGGLWALGGDKAPAASVPIARSRVPTTADPGPPGMPPVSKPEPAPEAEAAPVIAADAAPKTLTVTVDSKPAGATVLRGATAVGHTPMELSWAADEAPPTVKLRLAGHEPVALTPRAQDAGGRLIAELKVRVDETPSQRSVKAASPPSLRPARRSSKEQPRFHMVE